MSRTRQPEAGDAREKPLAMRFPARLFFAASALTFDRIGFRNRCLLLKAAWMGSTAFIKELRERFPSK